MHYYYNVYYNMLMKAWMNMTPLQYGFLLIGIGVCGWVLMKNSR